MRKPGIARLAPATWIALTALLVALAAQPAAFSLGKAGRELAADAVDSLTAAAAPASRFLGYCDDGSPPPCLTAVTRNGSPLPVGYQVFGSVATLEGAVTVRLEAMKYGEHDLGAGDLAATWRFALDMGSVVPRVVSGKGRDAVVTRGGTSSSRTVTIRARPVTLSGQCDQTTWPWVCSEWAPEHHPLNHDWAATLSAEITDFGQWTDAAQRRTAYGLDYFTNVAATDLPPSVAHDGKTGTDYLRLNLANRRYREDGTTLVSGRVELRIPNAFLRTAYGCRTPRP